MSPAATGAAPARSTALAATIFVLLAAATLGGLFYARELKSRAPLLFVYGPAVVTVDPYGGRVHDAHFDVRTSVGDVVVASIVSERSGRVVRVLPPVIAHEYHHVSLSWNGRDASGALARPGDYRVRVHLRAQDATVTLTWLTLRLEAPPG